MIALAPGVIPALTLTQPWASLVVAKAKPIETRSWGTKYRGPLAIHAAQSWTKLDASLLHRPQFKAALSELPGPDICPRGVVVATCQLVGCVQIERDAVRYVRSDVAPFRVFEVDGVARLFGDVRAGRWLWLLADVTPLEIPIRAVGHLGLWYWRPPEGFVGSVVDHTAGAASIMEGTREQW